jgi:proteasome lid subunit RPN8/RPN11
MIIDAGTLDAIREHAMSSYPNEACGIVTSVGFEPKTNVAADPLKAWAMDPAEVDYDSVLGVVHSHPDGPDWPSALDMRGQIAMDVPYGLICCTAEATTPLWWWGASIERPPLLGRPFRHGPSGSDGRGDCYALIRDYYLAERGAHLPEFPRDQDWWLDGGNLYVDGFGQAGFTEVGGDPAPGDVLLFKIRSEVSNHGAVYLGNGLILHHTFQRLSRREPLGNWRFLVQKILRYGE